MLVLNGTTTPQCLKRFVTLNQYDRFDLWIKFFMSSFGTLFKVSTFGESHCKGVGCIVEGMPSGVCISESDIQVQLNRRRPGQSSLTTPVFVILI